MFRLRLPHALPLSPPWSIVRIMHVQKEIENELTHSRQGTIDTFSAQENAYQREGYANDL